MNILDENFPESQRPVLKNKRIPFRQIGKDIGRKGMEDEEIVTLLHRLDRPTLFTLDEDFYDRRLCHERYCLVYLDVEEETAAAYIGKVLRHRQLKTKANRMGRVIRTFPTGLTAWLVHEKQEAHLSWKP